ncbi:hypothetical protein NicSoilB4_34460 [Arthrobacter sp. NicSoilB4]|uniref:PepSY domain-containing protein n=1 Tax=Arthrobacter sp. NicSoilB4 TaxID=2830997 RepID=UPI001CC678C5|nr:hypothetical protein [Arthrobacter sp. NicSoilB4]BCW68683.1 hypothetical protein NicSoilB4_34460 [Arthrobacter sp. NicSoilB4]
MGKKAVLITGIAAAAAILGGATVAVAASTQTTALRFPDAGVAAVNLDRPLRADTPETPGQDDDSNLPALNAEDRDKAGNAALATVGQGTVSEVERENEGGSAYEVEVRLNDGTQVEVQLGSDFQVLSQGTPERDDD